MPRFAILDTDKRARQKQAARDHDAERLASGAVNIDDLRKEKSFFGSLPLHQFRIVAIGGRKIPGRSQ